ncbi:catalase [Kiloniella spongiae]|uniref:Catalase-related peroxidase n=1 Tax=Kiloniella spongiae TaxID=1489064 RepID=A0A0H2MHW1_9PROT|nr:catalase [Kiloniella spongiae]
MFTYLTFSGEVLSDGFDTATDTVNSFEELFGVTEGKRRNHTKGFCFTGTLYPADKAIQRYSNSPIFSSESKVIGRLSHKGGNNSASDAKAAEYGMGLAITTTNDEEHLMALNTLDFFPVRTPKAFAELMAAKVQGKEAVKAFKATNKNLQRFKKHEAGKKKKLTPYEGSTYNSINSFYLINDTDDKTAVRWSFIPTRPQKIVLEPQQDFFFENMNKNLNDGIIAWDMQITLANKTDDVDNAAVPWQGKHRKIIAAHLKVDAISSEKDGHCDNINFDPLVLSTGFEASNDPLLQARRDSYAISFSRRLGEQN